MITDSKQQENSVFFSVRCADIFVNYRTGVLER
jgi:hypothetical protein